MSDDLTLSVRLKADGSGLTGEFRRADKDVAQFAATLDGVGRGGRRAGQGVQQFGKSSREAHREAVKLQGASSGLRESFGSLRGMLATLGVGLLAKDLASTIIETERLEASLVTVTGSIGAAQAQFGRLEAFAASTPYQVAQVTDSFIKLQAYGLEPSEKALTSYGNTASAMGKDLNQMIEAVADAATGEFERLKEFGIKASQQGDQVAFTFQGVTTTVANESAAIQDYLMRIGETNFAGAMERQMERLPGQLSNLSDAVDALWRELGDAGVTSLLTESVAMATDAITWLKEEVASGWAFDTIRADVELWVAELSAGANFIIDQLANLWGAYDRWVGSIYADLTGGRVQDIMGALTFALEFVVDSLRNLPTNLKAVIAIMIAETHKFVINAGALLSEWGVAWDEGVENLRYGWVAFTLELERKWKRALDELMKSTAEWVDKTAAMIENVPGMKEMAAQMRSGASALRDMAQGEAEVTAKLQEQAKIHSETLESLSLQRQMIEQRREVMVDTANAAADAALEEREAALAARDARFEELQLERERKQTSEEAAAAAGEHRNQLSEVGAAATELADIYEDVGDTIRSTFRSAFRDILDGGTNLADRLEGVFKDMLADLATTAVTDPAALTDATGQLESLRKLAGIDESADAAAGGGWMQYAGPLASMGAMYAAAGVGGYQLGQQIGNGQGAAWAGAAGALQGTVWGGPVGSYLGALGGVKLADALGIGGEYTDPGGRIASGSAIGSYDRSVSATGAFGSVGWASGAHHVGGEDKTPAAKAFFAALVELDDTLAGFLSDDEVARVQQALDGWKSSADGAFEDFEAMSRERLEEIFGALDGRLAASMENFSGTAQEAAEYAVQLAAAWSAHNQVLEQVSDTIARLNGSEAGSLARFSEDIAETREALAGADDFIARQALEQQMYAQVMARYDAEKRVLTEVASLLDGMYQSVTELRAQIGADIGQITGAAGPRDITEIFRSLSSIAPAGAPSIQGYMDAQANADALTAQAQSQAAQEAATAAQEAAADSLERYRAELAQYAESVEPHIDQLRRLRDETLAYYEAQQRLEQAMTGAADTLGATLDKLRRDRMSTPALLDEDLAAFRSLAGQAAGASGYELAGLAEQLNAMVHPLLSEAEAMYASGQGYQQIYQQVTGTLADVQARLLEEAPQGYEQASVDLLSGIDEQLATIEQTLVSQDTLVVDAIDRSRDRTVAALERIEALLEEGGQGGTTQIVMPGESQEAAFDRLMEEIRRRMERGELGVITA